MKKEEKINNEEKVIKEENKVDIIKEICNKELSDDDYSNRIVKLIIDKISSIIDVFSFKEKYDILFLYDINNSITQITSDKIYSDICKDKKSLYC